MKKKVLESKVKVRFHDCDPFNHLNNSRYIDYIITARADQLIDNYQLDIYDYTRKNGLGWVTAQTQISYLSPAYLMEELIIETQLIAFTPKSLSLEAYVWNTNKTEIKAVMWTKLVHFNLKTKQAQVHPDELQSLFASVVNPLSEPVDFESRVKNLKIMKS
ncbi:MAG: acyl-CoA thioesterase [Spirosomataceae bacterium]